MGSVSWYILSWNVPSSFSGINSGSRYFFSTLQAGAVLRAEFKFYKRAVHAEREKGERERERERERETGVVCCLVSLALPSSAIAAVVSDFTTSKDFVLRVLACMEGLPVL
jgi:hypothetical protein